MNLIENQALTEPFGRFGKLLDNQLVIIIIVNTPVTYNP